VSGNNQQTVYVVPVDIFSPDKHALDKEWVNQPRLLHDSALELADAREEYERAKARFKVVTAELKMDIRANPAKYGVSKVTVDAVEDIAVSHKEWWRANEAVIKAKHLVDVLEADVQALEHRKKALESLVVLQGRDYYASPRAPENVRERLQEVEKQDVRNRGKTRKGE
jgi:hypothetical protein